MKQRLPSWLFVLFLTLLATATDEFIIAGVLKTIAADLDVSLSAAGQLVTVFAVVYALGAPTLAVVCERFPKRSVMIVGLLCFVVANVVAALAPGYWILMGARVFAGLAAAIVTSAAFTTTAMGAPEGMQGRYLGVVTSGMTAALFTGVPLGSWLGGAFGWRATFWLIAGVGAIAALGLLVTAPNIPGSNSAPLKERLSPLRNAAVLRLVMVTFLAASGGLMFYTYLGAYTTEVAHGSYHMLSVMLFIVGVAGLAGALLAGRAIDARGPRTGLKLVIGGHVIGLALAALLVFSGIGNPIVLGVVIAFWAVWAWGLNPPIQGSIMGAAGPQVGMTALALNISGLYLGTGVAGAIGGAIVGFADIKWVPVAATVMMTLSFFLIPKAAPQESGAAGSAGEPQDMTESQPAGT
ncbi:MFS transporter [Streptomyces sp. RY43-2]|uniref:MFS transporter n=1 Tax=Streptomyces macrolidinus TaxID=2952607 RepID=A0ABT0ZH65_9ACTN|nr:MFS transporter [Streptomyces macrolidinus]MCN9242932.1 MFS transporter [Streptomyces macrolidinus]